METSTKPEFIFTCIEVELQQFVFFFSLTYKSLGLAIGMLYCVKAQKLNVRMSLVGIFHYLLEAFNIYCQCDEKEEEN